MSTHGHIRRWYQDWFKDLLRFFERHRQSRADAYDLAQEVYLRLLRAENLALVDHPRAYVHKIASNVLAEWTVRARQSKPHGPEGLDDLLDPADPLEQVDADQRNKTLTDAIARLPQSLRAALVLHCQESMSYREIAQRIGASERMVKRYLKNAYTQLRLDVETPPLPNLPPQEDRP